MTFNKKRVKSVVYTFILAAILAGVWFYPLILSNSKPSFVKLGLIEQNTDNLQDNSFYYPSLGIKSPFTIIDKNPLVAKNWSIFRQALTEGVAVTSEKDFEDEKLIYVIGHSTDRYPHQYSSIFSTLDKSQIGETFIIKKDGQIYEYTIAEKEILNPRDIKSFSNLESKDPSIQRVALVTCWPLFTTKNRLVVVGERNILNSL